MHYQINQSNKKHLQAVTSG